MNKRTKHKLRTAFWKHTSVTTALCMFLSSFLVSFSSSQEDGFSAVEMESSPLLSPHEVLKANPVRVGYWQKFNPSWEQFSLLELERRFQGNATHHKDNWSLAFTDLDKLMEDPSNRLESEFKIPAGLRGRVGFWLQVFGRYSSDIKIVHDKRNPEIIFGTISGANSYGAERTERFVLKALKDRIKEAAGLSETQLLSDLERQSLRSLLELAGGLDEKNVRRILRDLRTQTGQRDHFLAGIQRSQILMPQIEAIFAERGLPLGLTRIPFVESSFNPNAFSRIGAIGLWQFVRETAKQMIHRDSVELWRDPIAQSKAAAKLLQLYRNVLPNWGLAVTAYNSGVGRIRRLSQKYEVETVEDFQNIPIKEDLGFAGRNFFAEVLAVNLLEQYKDIIFEHELSPFESHIVFKSPGIKERKQRF